MGREFQSFCIYDEQFAIPTSYASTTEFTIMIQGLHETLIDYDSRLQDLAVCITVQVSEKTSSIHAVSTRLIAYHDADRPDNGISKVDRKLKSSELSLFSLYSPDAKSARRIALWKNMSCCSEAENHRSVREDRV